jgi:hypothetical protein
MPTANRRRWMCDYMKDYRQGKLRGAVPRASADPARSDELRTANRLHTFKWRISVLLGPQYEILICMQYGPEYMDFKIDDGFILGYGEDFLFNRKWILEAFSPLEEFKNACDAGGGELFKAFLIRKYSRRRNRATNCVVGVLDKAALLENLQRLPNQGGRRWAEVLHKVKIEAAKGGWRNLDFTSEPMLWLSGHIMCHPLKWTVRKHPKWSSPVLHSRLLGWAIGVRKTSRGERYERPTAHGDYPMRLIRSPILSCGVIA